MTKKFKSIIVVCSMAVFLLGMSLFAWVKPVDKYSKSERRYLSGFPDLTWNTIMSGKFMTDFEEYTLDQFPLRDEFRTLKALSALYLFNQAANNDIYLVDGYASKIEYPLKESAIDNAAAKFMRLYEKYMKDKDINVYLSVIPDKNYFLAENNGYLSMDYELFINSLKDKTADYMEYIDIVDLLEIEDYYKTDTHWRQEAITDVADKILDAMNDHDVSESENSNGEGLEKVPEIVSGQEYDKILLDNPFYGVYYGQSALTLEAEDIYYLNNDILDNCIVYDYENSKNIPVYDMEKAYGKDPYEMFLSGPLSLITIENSNATNDKELIVFRDSFGSSIAPLFAEEYAKITLVDIRYIQSDMLGRFIEFDNQDVLFIYSTLVLNNSETFR